MKGYLEIQIILPPRGYSAWNCMPLNLREQLIGSSFALTSNDSGNSLSSLPPPPCFLCKLYKVLQKACKPWSYASLKLCPPSDPVTESVECRATSVARNMNTRQTTNLFYSFVRSSLCCDALLWFMWQQTTFSTFNQSNAMQFQNSCSKFLGHYHGHEGTRQIYICHKHPTKQTKQTTNATIWHDGAYPRPYTSLF